MYKKLFMDEFWKNLASLQEKCKNIKYIVEANPAAHSDIAWILWDMEHCIGEMRYALYQARGKREGT